jgi:hypothetical protein
MTRWEPGNLGRPVDSDARGSLGYKLHLLRGLHIALHARLTHARDISDEVREFDTTFRTGSRHLIGFRHTCALFSIIFKECYGACNARMRCLSPSNHRSKRRPLARALLILSHVLFPETGKDPQKRRSRAFYESLKLYYKSLKYL